MTPPATAAIRAHAQGAFGNAAELRHAETGLKSCPAGIEPLRRVYDLRHAFATVALRAGISTFDLSRYMERAWR